MSELVGEVTTPQLLGEADLEAMFAIMDRVYAGMTREYFVCDLAAKDEVILLRTPSGQIGGFSTQQILKLSGELGPVTGVFSGDTVIAPEHWGTPVLFQTFARRYIRHRPQPWYWFLIVKGHRTYRLLPTFFVDYWPHRKHPTPDWAQNLMHAYASRLYPDDYDPDSGVVAYRQAKDRLRTGVAGLTEQVLRNPEAAFFAERNPGHRLGHDLVCLSILDPDNLRPRHRGLLLGES